MFPTLPMRLQVKAVIKPQPDIAGGEVKTEGRRNGRRTANSRRTSRSGAENPRGTSASQQADEDAPAEKLSKDASLLPSSLIGKTADSEGDTVPPVGDD